MNEQELMQKLETEGFDKVWIYDAPAGEIDEEHAHDYDTKLVILSGEISITSVLGGAVANMNYKAGAEVVIPRNKPHSAKVGPNGCRYIVAEKH